MFILASKITITQVSKAPNVGRTKKFTFNYVQDVDIDSTWAHLTDTAKVVLPRKIFYKNEAGKKVAWATNTDIYGNPNKSPLIMRGDKIKIELGYFYFSGGTPRVLISKFNTEFEGFITSIENKMPVVLHCEDLMYQFKQTQVPDKVWDGKTYTIETMLQEMLTANPDNAGIKVLVDNFQHKTGDFITKGVTLAQVLDEIRSNYHLESYIRKNALGVTELRCGIIRYYPGDRVNHILHFQKNVAGDDLTYTRDTDVRIGIKAVSINKVKLQATNSAGKFKTTSKRLEINVGPQDGEIRTLFFPDIEDPAELRKQAEICLPYLKYEGFRGSIQSFGLPFIKHGDSLQLIDAIIKERKGTYLVKQVKVKFGMGGFRRTSGLDIRIDGLSAGELTKFQNFGL